MDTGIHSPFNNHHMAPSVSTIAGDFYEEDYRELKRLYKKAADTSNAEFQFHGQPMLTQFAKYLLEFLQPHFVKQKI